MYVNIIDKLSKIRFFFGHFLKQKREIKNYTYHKTYNLFTECLEAGRMRRPVNSTIFRAEYI